MTLQKIKISSGFLIAEPAIFDAQGVPLATFGGPLSRQRGSKGARGPSTRTHLARFGSPFSVQNVPSTDFSDFGPIELEKRFGKPRFEKKTVWPKLTVGQN